MCVWGTIGNIRSRDRKSKCGLYSTDLQMVLQVNGELQMTFQDSSRIPFLIGKIKCLWEDGLGSTAWRCKKTRL